MNQEQIQKLHAEAQHDLLAGAKAKNIDLQDIIALCQAAERATAPVSLTDEGIIACAAEIFDFKPHKQDEEQKAKWISFARAILASAPAPIQKDPQEVQLVTTTYAKAHSTTVIVNLVKGNVTTCLYSADHSANGKTIGVSDLPDGLSLAVKQSPEPCGGCGETDPSKRCIGCRHPFSAPSPAVAVEDETPAAYIAQLSKTSHKSLTWSNHGGFIGTEYIPLYTRPSPSLAVRDVPREPTAFMVASALRQREVGGDMTDIWRSMWDAAIREQQT